MRDHNENNELRPNWVDYSVSGIRGGVNLVPIVGPFLAEIVGETIPNQRLDRIAKFAAELDRRLNYVEVFVLDNQLENEEFADLIEEGFRQASRSLSDERRSYIASLIVNGLTSDRIEFSEAKHLLRMLSEINDIEVVWLRYFREPTIEGDEQFRDSHKKVLEPVTALVSSTQETRDKHALQESYQEHLAQLGLIVREYETDMHTGFPEFDRFSGAMKVSGYYLSGPGSLLLREIGLGGTDG